MSRRVLIPLLIVATLIAAVVVLPRTPRVRSWLLAQAVGVVEGLGYRLTFDRNAGNPWRGIELGGVELTGPGVDVAVERLVIGYFLPALLTGELPLTVSADTVSGRLELDAVELGGGGGAGPIRVRLRELDLADLELEVEEIPFSLPDLAFEGLSAAIRQGGDGVAVSGTLVSSDGRAPFAGTVTTAPFALDLEVTGADLTLSRHWWGGARQGHLDAEVRYGEDGLQIDGTVHDAAVELIGISFSDLSGPVRFRGLEVEANLAGRGLGGPVTADGTVDIAARVWRAHYGAEPDLAAAAAWLSPGVAATLADLGVQAQLTVAGEVGGWTDIGASGDVTFEGEFLGEPIEEGTAGYRYRGGDVEVDGTGRWAGGSLAAELRPADGGFDLSARLENAILPVAGSEVRGGGTIVYRQRSGGPNASYAAQLAGPLFGRALQLALDGTFDRDGWQAFVSGDDGLGASLEGALVLGPDGIEAGGTLRDLTLPEVPAPLTLQLRADGPPTQPVVSARVIAPERLLFEIGGARLAVDPRGELSATLTSGELSGLTGRLGPLTLSGSLAPAARTAEVAYRLAPTLVVVRAAEETELALTLGVTDGRFDWQGETYDHEASVTSEALALGPVALPGLRGELVQRSGEAWRFRGADERLDATLSADRDRLSLDLAGFVLDLAGREVSLAGDLSAALADPLGTLSGALSVSSGPLRLAARAEGGRLAASTDVPAGTDLFGQTLRRDAVLTGELDLATLAVRARADAGVAELALEGTLGAGQPLQGTLRSAERSAEVAFDPATLGWTFRGDVDLAALALLGFDAAGVLSGELAGTGAAARGSLGGELLRPLAAAVRLDVDGDRVELVASSEIAGLPLDVAGLVWPRQELTARVADLGTVTLQDGGIGGGGELPALSLGPLLLPGRPWQVSGSLADARATLTSGDSTVTASWAQGWAVEGRLEGELLLADTPLSLQLDGAVSSELPAGSLSGIVTVTDAADDGALRFSGSIDALEIDGQVGAALLSELAGLDAVTPAGRVRLTGTVATRDGPSYDLAGAWSGDGFALELAAVGRGLTAEVSARGDGVEARFDGGGLAVRFDGVELAPFLVEPELAGVADGALTVVPGSHWSGDVRVALQRPLAAEVRLFEEGGALLAEARLSDPRFEAALEGRVLPDLAVRGEAELPAGRVRLTATATGSLGAPEIAGAVTTEPLELAGRLRLPAVHADLSVDLAARTVAARGPGIAVTVGLDRLDGTVAVEVGIDGVPHLTELTLDGSPAAPAGRLLLAGPLAEGTIDVADETASAELTLAPELLPVATAADLGLALGRTQVTGTIDLDGRWQAQAVAPALVRDLSAELRATAGGEGLDYRGEVEAREADAAGTTLAAARVHGRGSAAEIEVDLATVAVDRLAALFGLPLAGEASGSLQLTTAPLDYRLDTRLVGEAAGVAFELTATAGAGADIEAAVTALGFEATAAGTPARAAVTLRGPRIDLSGDVAWDGALALALAGSAAGEALAAELEYDPAAQTGSVRARALGIELESELLGPPATLEARGTLSANDLPALGGAGGADFGLRRDATGAIAARLEATVAGGPLPATARLEGELLPRLTLRGEVDVGQPYGVLEVAIAEVASGDAGDAGYVVTAERGGLRAEARLGGDLTPLEVALRGDGELPVAGQRVRIVEPDLVWRPDDGFSGRTLLAVTAAGFDIEAAVTGAGGLEADVRLLRGGPVAEGHVALTSRPWSDRSLQGRLDYRVDPGLVPQFELPDGLALVGQATLSGVWDDPALEADAALLGPVPAAGGWSYRAGSGELSLSGDGLHLAADADAEGWRARIDVTGYPLAATLPWLPGSRLSAEGDAMGTWGGLFRAVLPNVALRAGSSSVEGRATLQLGGGPIAYAGVVRIDMDLADLAPEALLPAASLQGRELQGRVRGPLAISGEGSDLTSATLSGLLALTRVGVPDVLPGPTLGGTVQLSGTAGDPLVSLQLEGTGEASGTLRGSLRPLGPSASLDSDLRFGPLATDLALSLDGARLRASGTLAYGDLRLRLEPEGDELLVLGEGRLEGVRGSLSPDERWARIGAPLAALAPGLTGDLELTMALPQADRPGPWLRGSLVRPELAGIEFGDLAIVSASIGDEIVVTGERLSGVFDLGAELSWRVELAGVQLADGLTLRGSGAGAAARGELSGELSGELAGRPLALPLTLELGDAVRVEAAGAAFGGGVELRAQLDPAAGWSGALSLTDAAFGPEVLSLSGTLSGPPDSPRLALDGGAAGPVTAELSLAASLDDVRVTGTAALPGLPDRVDVEGTLWPQPALTLSLSGNPGVLAVAADAPTLDDALRFDGALETTIGPVRVTLRGEAGALVAEVRPGPALALPGLALTGEPLGGSVGAIVGALAERGYTLRGAERTTGQVTVRLDGPRAEAEGLRYLGEDVGIELDGELVWGGSTRLTGRIDLGDGPAPSPLLESTSVRFALTGDGELWSLLLDAEQGRIEAELDPAARSGRVRGALSVGGGSVTADLTLSPQDARGQVLLERVRPLGVPGLAEFTLSGRIDALGDRLSGSLDLEEIGGRGGAEVDGSYALAGVWNGEFGLDALDVDARLRTFSLQSLPQVVERAPNLSGAVSGVAQLRGGRVVGRLVAPGLGVLDTPLPTSIDFNGNLGRLDVRASVSGSPLTAQVTPEAISALLRLERFPMEVLVEAVAGATDISAEVTGVTRLELPFAAPGRADVRVATELIRLESDGVVTTGNAIFDYNDGAVTVEDITFSGTGRWQASGVVRSDLLDFTVTADSADFGPLLGLVPALARLDPGATGSLQLVAGGSLTRPTVSVTSADLTLSLAGSTYRFEGASLALEGTELTVAAAVVGLSPVVGRLEVAGGGRLSLTPLRLAEAEFDLAGSATVPILGDVTELTGTLVMATGRAPTVSARGRVGNPFSVEGTLAPLALRLRGDGLAVRAPNLLLDASTMDVDVTVGYSDALDIGGTLLIDEARFQLGIRPPASGGGGSSRALEQVRFTGLRIEATDRVFFSESFANLEARAELVLSGTAADPRLSGTASAVRGSIRFSGRDFTIEEGIASFEPSRGMYPLIDMTAVTSFEKSRVLPAGAQVRFVEPRGGSRFDVVLQFDGAVEPRPGGGFSLDFDPELSSDARIEVQGEAALTSGPRTLTPSELLALVTLGRLDISTILTGEGALVTAVAQGALDTAVDLLVLAELQQALQEALGVEMVEIRTTALSSLLDGARDDPFGVSLRLGGYLSEEIFASFQIGSFDDADAEFALTNEVRFTYALGPVELDVAGGVNFAAAEALSPIPELSSSIRYAITPLFGLEAGADLSSVGSQVRFGVTVRW